MKINIITFAHAYNYGAMLQAYSLRKFLEDNGYETKILDYRDYYIEKNYKAIRINKTSIKTIVKSTIGSILFYHKNKRRYLNCKEFEINNLIFTDKKFYKEKELENYSGCDILICGSDQIWNYQITGKASDVYTLNFGSVQKKISYAASIGDLKLFATKESEYLKKIKKIDYISVREDDANAYLSNKLNKRIKTTLDPTLLIERREWNRLIQEQTTQDAKEKYIVAYYIDPDEEFIKIANYISSKTGYKIIYFSMRNPGFKNIYKNAYTDGPLQFIKYIRDAEYVVATSFHATVFSLLYEKEFYIIPHKKTGARVKSLLRRLGLDDRIYTNLMDFKKDNLNKKINWDSVNEILKRDIADSKKWLLNSIEDKKAVDKTNKISYKHTLQKNEHEPQ